MAKIIVWLVVVFAVLFALRLVNVAGARRRDRSPGAGKAAPPASPMVRCTRCGVFLPEADAKRIGSGFICGDASCARRP